MKDKIIIVRRV